MATKQTKKKPKPKHEAAKPEREGNYLAGDLPAIPQEKVKELAREKRLTAVEYELLKSEIDRASRKIDAVQDWPDHAERAHSATGTLSYAKLPIFKVADKRIALSKNQPNLQMARGTKQVEGGDTIREAYRKIAAGMIRSSVKKTPNKKLKHDVIAVAIEQGLPERKPSVVEKYLVGLSDSDL